MRALRILALTGLVAADASRALAADPNFEAAGREAVSLLQQYLRVDTTNPPGNERRAADFFKGIFDREGIANRVYDLGNGRANILARLPGRGGRPPIILLNHMDVVPADAARWTVPPFSGELRDGYVWGRGATDMKGTGICQLMTVLLLKRGGVPLERDVIFLGTADEEAGKQNGVSAMVSQYREDLENAEFVLTEGDTLSVENGRTTAWSVDITEKAPLWLRVTARGRAGHASVPEPDGAVARLIRALSRIIAYEPPPRIVPPCVPTSANWRRRRRGRSSRPFRIRMRRFGIRPCGGSFWSTRSVMPTCGRRSRSRACRAATRSTSSLPRRPRRSTAVFFRATIPRRFWPRSRRSRRIRRSTGR